MGWTRIKDEFCSHCRRTDCTGNAKSRHCRRSSMAYWMDGQDQRGMWLAYVVSRRTL